MTSINNRDFNTIEKLVKNALFEDLQTGDITSELLIPIDQTCEGEFYLKEEGLIAGFDIAELAFKTIDETINFNPLVEEGLLLDKNTIIAKVSGRSKSILNVERTTLNILQRMSGIATETKKYVDLISHTKCKILDTRKTMPGLRIIDKMAIKIGGGYNHRMGLYDMILIKDNHINAVGGPEEAIRIAKEKVHNQYMIEIEVKSIEELKTIIPFKPDKIMLDNMDIKDIKKAVSLTEGKIPLEASGNINLNTAKKIAETGVDYISVGRLTNSTKSLDISFLLVQK